MRAETCSPSMSGLACPCCYQDCKEQMQDGPRPHGLQLSGPILHLCLSVGWRVAQDQRESRPCGPAVVGIRSFLPLASVPAPAVCLGVGRLGDLPRASSASEITVGPRLGAT